MNKDYPQISVVIPLYNKREFLLRAVNSVIAQTFTDFELLVVNDGSTDGSEHELKSITDPRLRLLNQRNSGVSIARNTGIENAKADIIAFLDADDYYDPEFLSSIKYLAEKFPDAGAYATGFYRLYPGGKTELPDFGKVHNETNWSGVIRDYFASATVYPPFFSSSVAVKKSTFKVAGNFEPGVKMGEDIDMWMRIALLFPVAYCKRPLSYYSQESETSATKIVKRELYDFSQTRKLLETSGEELHRKFPSLKEYLNMINLETAAGLIMNGKRDDAKKILSKIETKRFVKEKKWWSLMSMFPHFIIQFAHAIKRSFA